MKDEPQYADVGLNLISNKVIKTGKLIEQYDNFGIMNLVIGEYKNCKVQNSGLSPPRVIYCIPTILHVSVVESSLA